MSSKPRSSHRCFSAWRPLCLPSTSLRFGHADRLRVHDLVGGLLFEVAILVDAGFVRERVVADDGLVRLRPERDDAASATGWTDRSAR